MQKESQQFLINLLDTASPSGFEPPIQKVVRRRMQKFADTIEVDVHGNLIAAVNPDAEIRVMLAGHCDQIGMMINYIDDSGYLYFGQIGGLDPAVLPGLRVTVLTESGPLPGVIGSKPVHLIPAEERGKKVELSKLWIDIGAKDGAEAKSLVRIGDPCTFQLGAELLGKHRVSAPGCDDKVGLFVVMEALRLFAAAKRKDSPVGLFAVSTVQEELGLRGAKTSIFGIDPQVGIAADVTHASDNPGADAKSIGTVKLGMGPVVVRGPNANTALQELMVATAKAKKIPYQTLALGAAAGNDANVMQISRAGVATGIVAIPNRYMHTPIEICDLRDLEASAKLIAETVLRITKRTSFIPA